jgi:hypothetical protein
VPDLLHAQPLATSPGSGSRARIRDFLPRHSGVPSAPSARVDQGTAA